MSKSTNTVVYFDWKTVIYTYEILTWPHSFPLLKKNRIISSYYLSLISTCADECDWRFHWQHKLCATFSAIKVYYRICTLRHIRIEINHGSRSVFWVLTIFLDNIITFIARALLILSICWHWLVQIFHIITSGGCPKNGYLHNNNNIRSMWYISIVLFFQNDCIWIGNMEVSIFRTATRSYYMENLY
jgi:hypothetical protein